MAEKEHKTELLAPAGEKESVIAAVQAGADAVYLGAESFSARASAKNLSAEELLWALDYAHLYGRKIYLTCNILMREEELSRLYALMDPLYGNGLDGVIVQDLGVVAMLKRRYPELPLHASTQMAVLSAAGASFLKEMGMERVVPGRELSLTEIREIKATGIEVECFIHGAMCYAYSGRCLLSSLAGGRSGNRGRCAGPCRQRYALAEGSYRYLLSMKDMCALTSLGELLDVGVDSLKIEGRLKAPEYTAGVTSVYRKYIDRHKKGKKDSIEEEDMRLLEELYLRSERQEGYLHKHNGRDMISLDSPAYRPVSEDRKKELREKYIEKEKKLTADMYCRLYQGEDVLLSVNTEKAAVTVSGDMAMEAKKQPLSTEQIRRQLGKTGGSVFATGECMVDTDGASFLPLGKINELRREAFAGLRGELLKSYRRLLPAEIEENGKGNAERRHSAGRTCFAIGVKTAEQFECAMDHDMGDAVIVEPSLFLERKSCKKDIYLRLPEIIRQKDAEKIREELKEALRYPIKGIYCSSMDALAIALSLNKQGREFIHTEGGVYCWNTEAADLIGKYAGFVSYSAEQNGKELSVFAGKLPQMLGREMMIYGYQQVMYSAGCVWKTVNGCDKSKGIYRIRDEQGHSFPLLPVHSYCYNIMYNCLPLSLHGELREIMKYGEADICRLEFTVENSHEMGKILDLYYAIIENKDKTENVLPSGSFTRGHYRRGAL